MLIIPRGLGTDQQLITRGYGAKSTPVAKKSLIVPRGFGLGQQIITRGYGVADVIAYPSGNSLNIYLSDVSGATDPSVIEVFGAGGGYTAKERVEKVVSPYIRGLQLRMKLGLVRAETFLHGAKESIQEEEEILLLLASYLNESAIAGVHHEDEEEIEEIMYLMKNLLNTDNEK